MRSPDRARGSHSSVCIRYAVVSSLIVALGLSLRATTWAQPVGAEFQVNTYTTSSQAVPAVGPDGAGGFVVVWSSDGSSGTDGSYLSVQGQRYDSAGTAVGAEFQVNTYTGSYQFLPAVGPDGAGGFVVVWSSEGSSGTDTSSFSVQGQRYTSAGTAVGPEFQVNTYTTSLQYFPAVGPDGAGGFVVVWSSFGSSGTDTSSRSVQGQRYDSAGTAVGAEFQVNTYTTSVQGGAAVGPDGAGGFVVVWSSDGSSGTDGSYFSVQGQRYNSAGTAVGAEFQVNTFAGFSQYGPAVGPDGAGGFVVVWSSSSYPSYFGIGQDGSLSGVFGQRYSSTGSAIGTEFQVNTYTTHIQRGPAVGPDGAGGFVVGWVSNGSSGTDTSNDSVQGQRYNSAGTAVGAEFQVNTYTTSSQGGGGPILGPDGPAVGPDGAGGFVVVWASFGSSGTDTSSYSVQGQRFDSAGATTTTTSTTTTLPPSIPALSSLGGLLLGVLLVPPMVWGFRRRIIVGSSVLLRE